MLSPPSKRESSIVEPEEELTRWHDYGKTKMIVTTRKESILKNILCAHKLALSTLSFGGFDVHR
eukprot:scaffold4961_cov149-Amphora_coffeaeformis.AAC.4